MALPFGPFGLDPLDDFHGKVGGPVAVRRLVAEDEEDLVARTGGQIGPEVDVGIAVAYDLTREHDLRSLVGYRAFL